MAMARYCFRFPMYWSTKTSGAFAAYFACISGTGTPSLVGKSKYSGGFFGFGAHAAAVANCAAPKPGDCDASSDGDLASLTFFSFAIAISFIRSGAPGPPAPIGDMQHGLMM